MANVVRFALSTAKTLFVPGAGTFIAGILDVDANNLALLTKTRYLVQPYRAVELGTVDAATPKPTLPAVPGPPAPDPYPQYLTPAEAVALPELRAAFVTPPGNRAVVLGNSVDLGSDNPTTNTRGSSWFVYACIGSKQRLHYTRNAGVAGNTSAQMLARFDADVSPHTPDVVIVGPVENDADPANSITLASFAANVENIAARVRQIGAALVLRTGCPNNATGARKANILAMNGWLHANAARLGALCLLDFYAVLVDPANGNYKTGTNADSTHPNDAGHATLGAYAAAKLGPLLPDWTPLLAQDAVDTWNYAPNKGLFLAGTVNANGEPAGWFVNSPTSVAASIVTGDSAIIGNWWKGTYTASAAESSLFSPSIPLTGVDGHTFLYTARVKSALSAGSLSSFEVGFTATVAQTQRPAFAMGGPITDGVLLLRTVAPAGTTAVRLQHKVAAGSTGTMQLAQIGLFDLTAMGLA